MSDADINKFISITGADRSTAQFFLSATGGDCDGAVNQFFDSGGLIPTAAGTTGTGTGTGASSSAAGASSSGAPSSGRPRASAGASSTRPSRFATLASLGTNEDEDEDESMDYYVGGEKSGQVVRDRGRDDQPDEPRDLTDSILERARSRQPRTDEERERFSEHQSFTGAGYRLGASAPQAGERSRPDVVGRRNVTRTLTFYANGFVIDEGPLRRFDDPANEAFLADVNRGVVPREMEEPGIGDVSIMLVDKKGEDYIPPKKKVQPFTGGGQRLGSSSASPAPAAAVSAPAPVNSDAAGAAVQVDESRPTVRIQVRLADGSRLIARLNDYHTVNDLHNFVRNARTQTQSFTLSRTYPTKELGDFSQTLKDATLDGTVVVQRLK